MTCKFGYTDCIHLDSKDCILCVNGYKYKAEKKKQLGLKKKAAPKIKSKRQGNSQELETYKQTKNIVEGTPNSGAGKIKGDLQIGNMAMIECKTTTKKNINREPGKETFTIKKEWLTKLYTEKEDANKEFAYLVFSFKEEDKKLYAITDIEEINSMIATMKHDREKLLDNNKQLNVYKNRTAFIEAENTKLLAQVNYYKSLLEANNIKY